MGVLVEDAMTGVIAGLRVMRLLWAGARIG